jgi:hypothetical protein
MTEKSDERKALDEAVLALKIFSKSAENESRLEIAMRLAATEALRRIGRLVPDAVLT